MKPKSHTKKLPVGTDETKSQKPRVVIVGSVALDSIRTPKECRKDVLGGSLTFAAHACSFFSPTGIVGVVGADFPSKWVRLLAARGIDLEGLEQKPGKTFRWSGVYEKDMINRRTISTELNVFADFEPQLPVSYRSAPFLLLGNISPSLQLHVLEQIQKCCFVVADTMNLWIHTEKRQVRELVSRADILMLNDEEARLLAGRVHLSSCAEALMKLGPSYVVIKKGEHGAVLFSRDGTFLVPAYPVKEVRDPTGAGDTFAGAFVGALAAASGPLLKNIRSALVWAAVTASFCVEHFGAESLAALSGEMITRRRAELLDMIRL